MISLVEAPEPQAHRPFDSISVTSYFVLSIAIDRYGHRLPVYVLSRASAVLKSGLVSQSSNRMLLQRARSLLLALKYYICIRIGVCFPTLHLYVQPSTPEPSDCRFEAQNRRISDPILRKLGKIPDTVERKLVAGLDTAEIKTCIVHGLIYETALACLVSLNKSRQDSIAQCIPVLESPKAAPDLSRNVIGTFHQPVVEAAPAVNLSHRLVCFQIRISRGNRNPFMVA